MSTRSSTLNFAAGPSKLPDDVLKTAQEAIFDYNNTGIGVMELSHRSPAFGKIIDDARNSLRRLLAVPENFSILFLQGGGFGQFACVPMNLMGENGSADYIVSGSWSKHASVEAAKYGKVNVVNKVSEKYTDIADASTWKLNKDASYAYLCYNETVNGVEFAELPDTGSVPLVVDMSSNILTRPVDFTKVGVLIAGAQKNSGCAGVTVVIVRDDLRGNQLPVCPKVWNYQVMHEKGSMLNTPPTWSIYIAGLVYEWSLAQGGVEEFVKRCELKSKRLYDIIDGSGGFYSAPVAPSCRSKVNVPFRIGGGNEDLEKKFLTEAEAKGMVQLKGHRTVGGIRASMYNSMTVDEVECLAMFMEQFMAANKSA